MGFLDKINAAKNPAAQAEKKINPLTKKPPIAPVTTATAPAVAPVADPALSTKINPLLANKLTPLATSVNAEPKKPFTFPVKKPALPAVETKEEASELTVPDLPAGLSDTVSTNIESTTESVVVEPLESIPTEETVNELPVVDETVNEAPVVEEKKATSRRASSRSNAKKAAIAVDKAEETCSPSNTKAIDDTQPTTTISFAAAATALTSPFEDADWNAFKQEIEKELSEITINQDMNPGVLKVTLSELNIVYDKIAQSLHESKTLFDNLTNKEDGIIAVIKNISLGSGNNDMERKRAGFLAAMSYKPKSGDGNINLFETAAEVRARYNFLKSVYDRLKYKSDMLITMNGALKLESDFIRRGDN